MSASAQVYNPNINAVLSGLDSSIQLVREFQDFGTKTVGGNVIKNTAQWLVSEYESYGYDSVRVDSFEANSRTYRNIVVTKTGLGGEYIIICGHYDTRNGPGANDNGSGVAAILETARIIESLETQRSVIFIHFDGGRGGVYREQVLR